jgi:hypothetical protein
MLQYRLSWLKCFVVFLRFCNPMPGYFPPGSAAHYSRSLSTVVISSDALLSQSLTLTLITIIAQSSASFYGCSTDQLKCDGTRAETRFRLSAKQRSPFTSARASVQSTTGNRGVRISWSNAGYTMFRGSVRVLATHYIRQFPLHFPSRASPCANTYQLESTFRFSTLVDFTCSVHDNTNRLRKHADS